MAIIKNPLTLVKQEASSEYFDETSANYNGKYYACVVDYDGTIIKMQWLNNGETFEMPTPPTHSGLTFDDWTCTQAIVNNKITIDENNFLASPCYYTTSGLSEFDIELNEATGLTVEFYGRSQTNGYSQNDTIYWGDGTNDVASSSGYISHTYSSYGEYTIKTDTKTLSTPVFNQTSNYVYRYLAKNIRLPNGLTSISGGFPNLTNLRTITLPLFSSPFNISLGSNYLLICTNGFYSERSKTAFCYIADYRWSSFPNLTFQEWYSLKYFVFPKTVTFTTNLNTFFVSTYCLKNIVLPTTDSIDTLQTTFWNSKIEYLKIPNNIKHITGQCFNGISILKGIIFPNELLDIIGFQNFTSIPNIELPDSITAINNGCFQYGYGFVNMKFSKSLNSIGASAFTSCNNCLTFDFSKCEQIPTLANANAFNSTTGKILVPTSLYNDWIVATNWSSLASRIVAV